MKSRRASACSLTTPGRHHAVSVVKQALSYRSAESAGATGHEDGSAGVATHAAMSRVAAAPTVPK